MTDELVSVSTTRATTVPDLNDAFAFIMDCLDRDGIGDSPQVSIQPYWVPSDNENEHERLFTVSVSGGYEEPRRPDSPQVGRPRDDEVFSGLSDLLSTTAPDAPRLHTYTGETDGTCTLEARPLTPCGQPYLSEAHRGHRPDGEDCGFEVCGGGRMDPCDYDAIKIREFERLAIQELRDTNDGE